MKNKALTIFVVFLMTTSFFSYIVVANNIGISDGKIDINWKTSDSLLLSPLNNENDTEISTIGPISPLLFVTEIDIIDGPFFKIKLIEEILGNRLFHFIFPNISISVEDFTFIIKYTKDIPQLPILKRFFYSTTIKENGNETSYDTKHTVIVTGFEGKFGLYRTKPIRLYTAHFWFEGSCDEAIILT
jgi:hypothetical protein